LINKTALKLLLECEVKKKIERNGRDKKMEKNIVKGGAKKDGRLKDLIFKNVGVDGVESRVADGHVFVSEEAAVHKLPQQM